MRDYRTGWLTLLLLGSAAGGLSQGIITTVVGTDWSFPSTPRRAVDAPLREIRYPDITVMAVRRYAHR
jgi:hypothetical protein